MSESRLALANSKKEEEQEEEEDTAKKQQSREKKGTTTTHTHAHRETTENTKNGHTERAAAWWRVSLLVHLITMIVSVRATVSVLLPVSSRSPARVGLHGRRESGVNVSNSFVEARTSGDCTTSELTGTERVSLRGKRAVAERDRGGSRSGRE